jgi:homogentisate 1,2-dioxygenase
VINRDSSLIGQEQLRYSEAIRPAIVAAFAHDLGAAETSAGANVLAALAISVIHEIRRAGDVAPADDAAGDQIAVFDAGMATLRAAYGALKMRE